MSNHFNKLLYFCENFSFCDNRSISNFQSTSAKLLISEKISARDNRDSSNFLITSTKLLYFCKNFSMISAGQVFKWIYRNGLIFVDRLPRDNRDKLNFQVTTSTRFYFFSKISARDNRLKCNFSSYINKTAYF